MIADTLVCLLLVLGVVFGLSRPVADLFRLSPAETVVAGAGLSLLMAFAVAWAVFTTGCPLPAYWALPPLALAGLLGARAGTARLLADPGARDLLGGQLLVTGWCVGWLSFVRNHSGGAWTGDAFEHWERALYFLRLWRHDRLFLALYELPARPPLANVLTAAFLRMTAVDYAHFQVVSAALGSLAFLPVGLLAARFGGARAARVAALAVMASPLFVQNATYPWTKLPAAFFTLAGLYFFLRVRDGGGGRGRAALLCALLLGGAVLTHYSAGPYVVVVAAAWLATGGRRGWGGGFLAATARAALAGLLVLLPWFAWSVAGYGWHGTFLSNSSVMMMRIPGSPLLRMVLNLRDTLIPPQVRGFRGTLFLQTSPWGALRDQFFLVYQLNLLLALGLVGWVAVVREGARAAARPGERRFWALFIAGVVAASLATYGDHDHYGNAHICLQPLVLLGLAFLSSRWEVLGRGWRAALFAGWAADLCLGIGLQFAVEDFAIDRWLSPGLGLQEVSRTYSVVSQENLREKLLAGDAYFADLVPTRPGLILVLLGALLGVALVRALAAPPPGEPAPKGA